jgi:hypothetical protein
LQTLLADAAGSHPRTTIHEAKGDPMSTSSPRDYDRSIIRFEVHVCRPEDGAVPASLLHPVFRAQLETMLAARFGGTLRSITLEHSDEETATYGVQFGSPVCAIDAAFCVDGAATAAGVSIPGGVIRTFPGDVDVPVSEANDIPCAAE